MNINNIIAGGNDIIHQRPSIDHIKYTALRKHSNINSSFLIPPVLIHENEIVNISKIKDGYAKIKKNGTSGWCNINYLWKQDLYTGKQKCIYDNSSFHTSSSHHSISYNITQPLQNVSSKLISQKSKHSSQQVSSYGCKHHTCINNPNMGGVGAVIIVKNNGKNYVIFGKERFGSNSNKYNVIGGKIDSGECPIVGLYREVSEEIKILKDSSKYDWDTFNKIFKKSGSIIAVQKLRTLIFFGIYEGNAHNILTYINNKIAIANSNPQLHHAKQEISKVKLINTNKKSIDGITEHNLTSYADSILTNYKNEIDRF